MIRERLKFFWTKNPLDLLNLQKLIDDKIKLEYQIENLRKENSAIDKEIDINWNKAKETKSPADELAFAEIITTLSKRRANNLKKISENSTRVRTFEDFINKIEERKRKSSLDPLTQGSQAEIDELTEKIKMYEEEKRQKDRTLVEQIDHKDSEIDDDVKDTWQAIKATKEKETYKVLIPEKQTFKEQKDLE
jgi:hypothetical protein